EFGDTWTDDDARSIIGFDLLDAAEVLRARGGVRLGATEIVERLHAGVIARVREQVPWRPGARRLLSELDRLDVPCALVTMSWRPLVDAVVEALAPLRFQAIVTGDEVTNGKPHPEPYLLAAKALGVDPDQCVAIEDSPTGIASAGAAGCVVIAVPNIIDIEPSPGRHVVPSLRQLTPARLGALVAATPPPAALRADPDSDVTPASPMERDRRRRRTGLIAAGVAVLAVLAVVGFVVLGGDGGGPDVDTAPASADAFAVHAWAPYWTLDDALPALEANAAALDEVSPLWFNVTGVEAIEVDVGASTDQTAQFIAAARAAGVPVVPAIFDRTDEGVMAGILADPQQRALHVDTIVAFASDGDYDGIDVDYEQFAFADDRDTWAATRPNWVAFVGELADRLHADGRTLTVSIPPVYDAGRSSDSGYWVYDYAAITPLVDSIRIMAYDFSNANTDAGAVAPLDWVDRVIAGTVEASGDPSKLLLGIPLYGYNWVRATSGTCPESAEDTTTVSLLTVADLAARRGGVPEYDAATGELSFEYELTVDDGTTSCVQLRQVHYVDAAGAQVRMQRALDAGLGGVALFSLGYTDAAVWNAVATVAAGQGPDVAASTTNAQP
ncbi:MAG: HAD-IA family hydrolase, partial [Ilumatobacteraceae bacterium]